MKLIKKEFIETNEGILKKTYLMLPLKKKSIKNGIERKSIFGIQYSKKQLKTQKKKSHNGLNIAFIVGCKDGRSERYSVLDICDILEKNNINTDRYYAPFHELTDKISDYDLIVIFRTAISIKYNPELCSILKQAKQKNIPLVYSVDDLIFDESIIDYYPNTETWTQEDRKNVLDSIFGYKFAIKLCDYAFITSNYLSEKISKLVPKTYMFPCLISEKQFKIAQKINSKHKRHKKYIDICYLCGTPSHNRDFPLAEKAVYNILKQYPQTRLVLVGPIEIDKKFKKEFGERIIHHKLMSYTDLLKFTAQMDINLAPLEAENPFTKSKAPTKITEASLLKVPSVASPIPSYCDCITNGETGFLANTEKEWFDALSKLVEDKNLREKIAENSYNFVIKNFYINNLASEIVNTYMNIIQEQKNKQIKNNEPSINPIFNIKQLNIAFLIPAPFPNSGGHRNIFRAISHLKQSGHKLSVYYTGSDIDEDLMKESVSNWFYDMSDVNFIKYKNHMSYHDIAIATYWTTAYEIKKFENQFRYIFYMTQDNEAMFNPMSSNYILAENSYRLGFNHICSGPWMHNFITKKFQVTSDYFQFPVDTSIYNTKQPRTKQNKNIIFFAKPEMPRRCYEIGIQALKIFHEKCPDIEIILFGSSQLDKNQLSFPCTIKGLLPSLKELANLYQNADFGLVFSTTNPSLVPYEMMSCGCPVGDLRLEDALTKYGNSEENIFLLDPLPENMASELVTIFQNPNLMHQKALNGKNFVKENFPNEKEMGEKFENIILNSITKGEK